MASIERVVANGMCVGCGACSARTGGAIPVTVNRHGFFQASLDGLGEKQLAAGSRVCPFADETPDESTLAERLFSPEIGHDAEIGRHHGVFAGRVTDETSLLGGSSGGITTWLLMQLLEEGRVDGVIHVGAGSEPMFSYLVSRSAGELESRRKSIYYSTSMAEAILSVRGDGKRYAFVGVPCFITAARHLAREDPVIGEQLRYFVGIVCGHLKSAAFAQLLAWQLGVEPDQLASADFRVKTDGRDASDYDFAATSKDGEVVQGRTRGLVGGNWGYAMFQLPACDYCDDVFAETADIVLGDAWLPEYRSDWRGTSLCVTRSIELETMLTEGAGRGELTLEPLTPQRAALSQAGNFRHRRDGLALRLADDLAAGQWVPRKRVAPGRSLSRRRKALVRSRRMLVRQSHVAFADALTKGSLDGFLATITPLMARHDAIARPSVVRRVATAPLRWIVHRLRASRAGRTPTEP